MTVKYNPFHPPLTTGARHDVKFYLIVLATQFDVGITKASMIELLQTPANVS